MPNRALMQSRLANSVGPRRETSDLTGLMRPLTVSWRGCGIHHQTFHACGLELHRAMVANLEHILGSGLLDIPSILGAEQRSARLVHPDARTPHGWLVGSKVPRSAPRASSIST